MTKSAYFDPAVQEHLGAAFIREDKVDDYLRVLVPNSHLSKGQYTYTTSSEPRDLSWNHMDQSHRPFIHKTYEDAMRVFIQKSATFSLTRFGNWPFVIPVFDGSHKENGFYQIISVFGLFVIVSVIESNQDVSGRVKFSSSWTIVSHRIFRCLHAALNRRLFRLNQVQSQEDSPIREQRVERRAAGYRFKTDIPNFENSNSAMHHTIFPEPVEPGSISLEDLPEDQAVRINVGNRAYIFCRTGSNVQVWPGVCVHEGAELGTDNLSNNTVKCPWHGLSYRARMLTEESPTVSLCGAELQLVAGRILLYAETHEAARPDPNR